MKLQAIRKEKKISQAQLAEMVGVSQSYISHLEIGIKTNPSLQVIRRIAKALAVRVADLMDDDEMAS